MDQAKRLNDMLIQNGHRLTFARQVVIETLVNSGGHITADQLAESVRTLAPQVGRMTVYRTLDLLCELGGVRPIFQGTGAAHYVLLHGGSHHHLICNLCHKVIEFDHCGAGSLIDQLSHQYGFEIHSHLLEFHGLCADCQAA